VCAQSTATGNTVASLYHDAHPHGSV